MKTLRKLTCLLCLLLLGSFAYAQKGLSIEQIFRDYGKTKGAIQIELAKDVLGNYSKINRYKSLIMSSDPAILSAVRKAIQKDCEENEGSAIKRSWKYGNLIEATYCLGKREQSPNYEYILYTLKKKEITLIYIRGDFPPERLTDELNNLKNLFIKVNNKQLKLQ